MVNHTEKVERKKTSGRRFVFVLQGFLFIMLVSNVLLGIVLYVRTNFPPVMDRNMMSMQPQLPVPFWKRYLEAWRQQKKQDSAQGNRQRLTGMGSPGGGGASVYGLPAEHMAMRELGEALSILAIQGEIEKDDAYRELKDFPQMGNFGDFELTRFTSRVHLHEAIDNGFPPRSVRELARSAAETADGAFANFEDIYLAGIGELLNGNVEAARTHLENAAEQWPARGRGYGNTIFFLMITHAVQGNEKELLPLILTFKEYYPDWMYVENYMSDFSDVLRVYGDRPLLNLVRAWCYFQVNNYRECEVDLALAKKGGPYSRATQALILQMENQIQEMGK